MKKLFIILFIISFTLSLQAKINPNQIEWQIPVNGNITATSFSGVPAPVGVTGVSIEALSESIKSLISGTITAMCIYERNKDDVFSPDDVRRDWWKKSDTSWFQEVGEFPERVLIVGADSLYIIDLDTQSVWMEFVRLAGTQLSFSGYSDVSTYPNTSVYAKNGIIYTGALGLSFIDFFEDGGKFINDGNVFHITKNISERANDVLPTALQEITTTKNIINNNVNSVHANVVNGTLYAVLGTNSGLSQINMETGVVYDWYSNNLPNAVNNVYLTENGEITITAKDNTNYHYWSGSLPILTADVSTDNYRGNSNLLYEGYYIGGTGATPITGSDDGFTANSDVKKFTVIPKKSLALKGSDVLIYGTQNKLTTVHRGVKGNEYYQYITPDYNTGLLYKNTAVVGNYLNGLDSVVADRSYRGNTLTNNGTVEISADITAPFGVSAGFNGTDQFLTSTDTDFVFTDKFLLSLWYRPTSQVGDKDLIGKWDSSANQREFLIFTQNGLIYFFAGTGTAGVSRAGVNLANGQFHHIVGVYSGSPALLDVYVNGVKTNGVLSGAIPASIFNGSAVFTIGARNNGSSNFINGSISQVKVFNALPADLDAWVKAEYELGRNSIGKTSTLQGNSAQVNSVSAFGDKILLSTGDSSNTGYIQTVSGGAVCETIEVTANANNLVLSSKDYTIYSVNTASALHLLRPSIDFLKYVQNLVYKPKETIFVKGTWASGGASITVTNPFITENSNIIAMPQSANQGSWYINNQSVGTVDIYSLSTEAYSVDYLLMINN